MDTMFTKKTKEWIVGVTWSIKNGLDCWQATLINECGLATEIFISQKNQNR